MTDDTPFKKQLDKGATFKTDLLSHLEKSEWPSRIDYVASKVHDGGYTIGIQSTNQAHISTGSHLEQVAGEHYLRGITALTGDAKRQTALPDDFRLGDLLVEFAELRDGLELVDHGDVPPGEILSRIVMRKVQRQADPKKAALARQLRADAETPRELVIELTTAPEVAPVVESALPNTNNPATLTTELAALDLTTELWPHQLESLALWLYHGINGYVDMATATGKTVLGLAAVAHTVDSGSLHPADQKWLDEHMGDALSNRYQERPNDVLIVTTDDLLGVQWARLFQEHCHTPPSFTTVEDNSITLPWGEIDIRSAKALSDVEPSDYRLAIFDEVHNYTGRSGWGENLAEFIKAPCPVLALTGSVTADLESLVERTGKSFPCVYRYTHRLALKNGVIPDFEWELKFTDVADTDSLNRFTETAEIFNGLVEYNTGTYRIASDKLDTRDIELTEKQQSAISGEYTSGAALASGLREAGGDGTAPTESLESLASGLSNRTIDRLNLDSSLAIVVEMAEEALADERPVLILTQSYSESKELWQELYERDRGHIIKRLEQGESASKHNKTIRDFDEADTNQKVLIGPGKRIGQGNDIHSVEVGINIARPGSGVNATLVQRLGRLLRDAGDKSTVNFFHVMGVPPKEATTDPDGESFVRSVSEFFAQALEPDTDGILKPPSVTLEDSIVPDVVALERRGAPHINDDPQSTVIESTYAAAINDQSEKNVPAVTTDWFSAAVGSTIHQKPHSGSDSEGSDSTPVRTSTKAGESMGQETSSNELVLAVHDVKEQPVHSAFISIVNDEVATHGRTDEAGELEIETAVENCTIAARHSKAGLATLKLESQPTDSRQTITLSENKRK